MDLNKRRQDDLLAQAMADTRQELPVPHLYPGVVYHSWDFNSQLYRSEARTWLRRRDADRIKWNEWVEVDEPTAIRWLATEWQCVVNKG